MNTEPNPSIENNPSYLKKQALKVLKKAKEQEAQTLANGGRYVNVGLRARVLTKNKCGQKQQTVSDSFGQKGVL